MFQIKDEEVEALVSARSGALTVANYYGELVTATGLREIAEAGGSLAFAGSDRDKYRDLMGKELRGTCCMTSY